MNVLLRSTNMSLVRHMDKLRQNGDILAVRLPIPPVTTESTLDDCDSWVELAPPSRGSLCSSIDALLLVEAQQQSYGSHHHSPKSMITSPNVELEAVKARLVKDTDWIWDWSSRPEALPNNARVPCLSLTTPPNSPAPELAIGYGLSLRHSPVITSVFFRVDVLLGLIVSNVFSLIVGAAIGFCISRSWSKGKLEY